MNVLITGGAGLVGHAITDLLNTTQTHKFIVVDNLLYADHYLRNVPFQYGNVGDPRFMIPLLKRVRPDVVIHLAGIVGDAACAARPKEAQEANITSIQILKDHFGGRIIFPSSCSVYGANDNLVDEESPLNPLSLYAQMKIQGEEILRGRPNTLILRLATLHGISGRLRNDLVINVLSIRAIVEKKMSVFGGEQYRPLLQVRDIARTMVEQIDGRGEGIFNLVEGNYRILDIANKIKAILPETEVEVTQMPFEDKRNYKASAAKAQKAWGFTAHYTIEDTVRDFIRIFEEGRIKDYTNIKYSNMATLQLKVKT